MLQEAVLLLIHGKNAVILEISKQKCLDNYANVGWSVCDIG